MEGSLQRQATGQTQQIAQLQQVISVHSGGIVTIQAIGTLNLTAGGNLNLTKSTIDLKDAITEVHGPFKADTDDDYPPPYTPDASNLWW